MSSDEIKSAILTMDQHTLSEAHIRQLLMYAPDSTEVKINITNSMLSLSNWLKFIVAEIQIFGGRYSQDGES